MIKVNTKPLSINKAYKGRRFKTKDYFNYENELILLTLPKKIEIPEGSLKLTVKFMFSSFLSDGDNPLKPFQDILQTKYKFNDNRILEWDIKKRKAEPGADCIYFELTKCDEEWD